MSLVWSPDYAPVDGDFADVSLLLKGEGTNGSTTILDSSSNNLSVSVNGDAQISTAVNTPFGTGDGVLAFDGTGDYLTAPSSTDWTLGSSGDFTIECWIYPNGSQGRNAGVVSTFTDWNSYQNRWAITVNNLTLRWYDSLGSVAISGSVLSAQWSHLAVSRFGSTVNLFVNGALAGTQTTNQVYTTQERLIVGIMPGQSDFNGYLSNLRITKGVARYTENFDVPTAPFPILSPSTRIEVGDGFDVEAANYILAVEAADAAALEPGVRTAINDFVVGCKADGIWDAIKASCILAGARTTNGALVPLKGAAPTPYNFDLVTDTDYNRKTGLVGDGSTKYLDSNRNNNADPQDSKHMSLTVSSLPTSGNARYPRLIAGPIVGSGPSYIIRNQNNGDLFFAVNSGSGTSSAAAGFVGVSRAASASFNMRINSSNTVFNQASSAPSVGNIAVFTEGGTTQRFYSNARLAFYSIGESLDLALLDTRISDFITAIGAAISP